MGLLGLELNVLTIAIAPLLVGIGVDDGIHVMERLRRGESSTDAVRGIGPAMIMTTLTTVAGFGCLLLADFGRARELGLVGAVGLIVALGAALHLLPTCYELAQRRDPSNPIGRPMNRA
jgi:predicted RND superfamily exporter protein